ncbi:HNH endonuclease signature motif containing protein [Turneriella parva]|uniref:HNH nuclease domain-containing protein n=1 Tax=Turneriella parva (strain ATCC BAA-1111 / DSM 21527 / NCTC 11395 / H) TaxID=869212 RepID=I4B1R7_TURPD|nr:HNH endonuclease signature motif containing protein [Turneriella parva]AFM11224.1 hypothetical protein Turpa_0572 [Turneriella parva DSM 21527]
MSSQKHNEIKERILAKCVRDVAGCLVWQGSIHGKDGTPILKVSGIKKQIRVRPFLMDTVLKSRPKRVKGCAMNALCIDPEHCARASERKTMREKLGNYRIIAETGCHVLKGRNNLAGYCQILHETRYLLAHREAYRLFKSEIETGKEVHHTCNTPACINPEHLVLVTPAENKLMAQRDGLLNGPRIRGEGHGNTRLKVIEIALIREMAANGISTKEIQKKYKLSRAQVRHIVRGLKHNNITLVARIYGESTYQGFRHTLNMIAENRADRSETVAVLDNGRIRHYYNDRRDECWLEIDFSLLSPWSRKILGIPNAA